MVSLVESLSKRSCLTINLNEQISKLVFLLKKYNIGCLVVIDDKNLSDLVPCELCKRLTSYRCNNSNAEETVK